MLSTFSIICLGGGLFWESGMFWSLQNDIPYSLEMPRMARKRQICSKMCCVPFWTCVGGRGRVGRPFSCIHFSQCTQNWGVNPKSAINDITLRCILFTNISTAQLISVFSIVSGSQDRAPLSHHCPLVGYGKIIYILAPSGGLEGPCVINGNQ